MLFAIVIVFSLFIYSLRRAIGREVLSDESGAKKKKRSLPRPFAMSKKLPPSLCHPRAGLDIHGLYYSSVNIQGSIMLGVGTDIIIIKWFPNLLWGYFIKLSQKPRAEIRYGSVFVGL